MGFLIVDDSGFMRMQLRQVFSSLAYFEFKEVVNKKYENNQRMPKKTGTFWFYFFVSWIFNTM